MIELKVGQIWKTGEGGLVLIREQWNGNEDHFQGDNGLIYRQYLNDGNRYFTFSWMSEEPSDLVEFQYYDPGGRMTFWDFAFFMVLVYFRKSIFNGFCHVLWVISNKDEEVKKEK